MSLEDGDPPSMPAHISSRVSSIHGRLRGHGASSRTARSLLDVTWDRASVVLYHRVFIFVDGASVPCNVFAARTILEIRSVWEKHAISNCRCALPLYDTPRPVSRTRGSCHGYLYHTASWVTRVETVKAIPRTYGRVDDIAHLLPLAGHSVPRGQNRGIFMETTEDTERMLAQSKLQENEWI